MSKTPCAPRPRRPLTRCLGHVLALLLVPFAAQAAQTNVTSTGQKLDFGSFAVLPSCSNCTITMGANGLRTASPGIYLLPTNGGKPATFSVGCNAGTCGYTATVTRSPTMAAGGVNMTVGMFTTAKGSPNTPSTLSVGGRLLIPRAGSTAGTFTSGIFTVTTTTP